MFLACMNTIAQDNEHSRRGNAVIIDYDDQQCSILELLPVTLKDIISDFLPFSCFTPKNTDL